ncbi:MAG: DUF2256 domain-containing protein [Pseudomonadota bacterium]
MPANSRSSTSMREVRKQSKICPVCKLPFYNRKKWASRGQWEQIVYCSDRCRKQGKAP